MAQTAKLGPGNDLAIEKNSIFGLERPVGTNVTNLGVPVITAAATTAGVTMKCYGGANALTVHLTLTNVAIAITDAGAAGAHGTLKLLDFPTGFGYRTHFRMAMDTISLSAGGDSGVTDIGVGSAAVSVANETLATTEQDIVLKDDITLSSGAASAEVITGVTASAVLGTATTKVAAHLNVAGTAATYSADGTMTLNGEILFEWVNLGG